MRRLQKSKISEPHISRNMRGQIQMFETIAVLLVFFFIMSFALGFYFFISKAGAAREAVRIQQAQAIEAAQRLTTLPELDCVKGGVGIERCVDELKIAALTKLLEDEDVNDYYFNTFGYTKFDIRRVYPSNQTFEVYERPSPQEQGYTFTQIPILMYNAINDSFAFGVVEVSHYG